MRLTVERRGFVDPGKLVSEVLKAIREASRIDYITFVPDGEPTLDANLGKEIRMLKEAISLKPIAVLSNASLLWIEDVRSDLYNADLVSVKIDSGNIALWKRINRPHKSLVYGKVLEGILEFARSFKGKLISETMLVSGLNTSEEELEAIAGVLRELRPAKAYIAVPVRPPAEKWVNPPTPEELVKAYAIVSKRIGEERVELLNMPEPPEFKVRGNPIAYILSLIRVHPLRYEYAVRILEENELDPEKALEEITREYGVSIVEYGNSEFLVYRPRLARS